MARMNRGSRWRWVTGAILMIALVAVVAMLISDAVFSCMHRRSQNRQVNIDSLTDSLKRAAEEKLAPPAIASEQMVITDVPDKIELRAKEVIDAAIQVGGTAVKTVNTDGSVSLLVQIPNMNNALFRGLVNKAQITKETAVRDGQTRLIEIVIQPQAAAVQP